jgi:hypothetical protein
MAKVTIMQVCADGSRVVKDERWDLAKGPESSGN